MKGDASADFFIERRIALEASDNRSENAVGVLTRNLERAVERQGISDGPEIDPVDPGDTAGDGDVTGDAADTGTVETSAAEFDTPDKPQKPVKPERPQKLERVERPDRPERPEKPERPGRPDRP